MATKPKYSQKQIEEMDAFLVKFGIDTEDLSQEEVIQKFEKVAAARAQKAQVLSLGPVNDGIKRLLAFVPKGFVGEWKRDRLDDIKSAEALGFSVLIDENANQSSETGSSDGRVRLGDCILMTMPEEEYVALKLAEIDARRRGRASRAYVMGKKKKAGETVVESDSMARIFSTS